MAQARTNTRVTDTHPDFGRDPTGEKVIVSPATLFASEMGEEPEDMALLNVIADLGGGSENDAEVKIYKQLANKKLEYLYSCNPDEFSLDKIRDEYGGGDFRVHVRAGGLLKANKLISIAAPKTPAIVAPANSAGEITALAQVMAQGFDKLGQLIVTVATQNHAPQESRKDMLQEMLLYKELFSSGAQPQQQQNPMQFMELFQKGVEFARDVAGEKGPGESTTTDVLLEALKSLGPVIASGAAQAGSRLTPQPQMRPMQPPPGTVPAQPGVPVPPPIPVVEPVVNSEEQNTVQTATNQQLEDFKEHLRMLVKQAAKNGNHELYGDMILEEIDPEELAQMVQHPQAIEILANLEPGVLQYRDWFQRLLDYIKAELTTDGFITYNGVTQVDSENQNANGIDDKPAEPNS